MTTAKPRKTSLQNKHLRICDYFALIPRRSLEKKLRFTVVCSRCRQNRERGNFILTALYLRPSCAFLCLIDPLTSLLELEQRVPQVAW